MAKCTYCGSKRTLCTNKIDRTWAFFVGLVVGAVGSIFNPAAGAAMGAKITKEQCPHKEYICLDCKKEFWLENS